MKAILGKYVLPIFVAFILFLTSGNPAQAQPPVEPSLVTESPSLSSDNRDVEDSLTQAGFREISLSIGANGAVVRTHNPWSTLDLDLRLEGNTGTVIAKGEKWMQSIFDLEIEEMQDDLRVFTLTNRATGEVQHFDSRKDGAAPVQAKDLVLQGPELAVAVAVFVGISLGTVLYYLAIGAAIIVAGYYAVEAAKAVHAAWKNNEKEKQNKPYLKAFRKDNKVFLGPSMSSGEATTWASRENDSWAYTSTNAKALCKRVGHGVPVHDSAHGSGYFNHFHPYNRTPHIHCFYGWPK